MMTQAHQTQDLHNSISTHTFDDGQFIRVGNELFVKLNTQRYSRTVGLFDFESEELVIQKTKKDLHVASDSYGIPHYLLQNASLFNAVRIMDEKLHALIPVVNILKEGAYMHFKEQGCELQVFISRKMMSRYSIRAKQEPLLLAS